MSRAALILAVIACAAAGYSITRPQPATGGNVSQAAEQYLADIAAQNSLRIDREQIVAIRTTGDEAVVLVKVWYTPFFQPGPGAPKLYGAQANVTLAVHMHRSQWNAGYAVPQ